MPLHPAPPCGAPLTGIAIWQKPSRCNFECSIHMSLYKFDEWGLLIEGSQRFWRPDTVSLLVACAPRRRPCHINSRAVVEGGVHVRAPHGSDLCMVNKYSFSKSFKKAADLARWSSGHHAVSNAVEAFQTEGDRKQGRKSNEDFLKRLRSAEERDAANQQVPVAAARATTSSLPPLPPGMRKQPGGDTFREVHAAQREAKLAEREAAAKARGRTRKLSGAELELASELFWKSDADASATIDRDEWKVLMAEIATRSGRTPFTDEEADAAFAMADTDGNGTLDLREWLAAQQRALERPEHGAASIISSAIQMSTAASSSTEAAVSAAAAAGGRGGRGSAGDASSSGTAGAGGGDDLGQQQQQQQQQQHNQHHHRSKSRGRSKSRSSAHDERRSTHDEKKRRSKDHREHRRHRHGSGSGGPEVLPSEPPSASYRPPEPEPEPEEETKSKSAPPLSKASTMVLGAANVPYVTFDESLQHRRRPSAQSRTDFFPYEEDDDDDDRMRDYDTFAIGPPAPAPVQRSHDRGGGVELDQQANISDSWMDSFKRLVGANASSSFVRRAASSAASVASHAVHSFRRKGGRPSGAGGRAGGQRAAEEGGKKLNAAQRRAAAQGARRNSR